MEVKNLIGKFSIYNEWQDLEFFRDYLNGLGIKKEISTKKKNCFNYLTKYIHYYYSNDLGFQIFIQFGIPLKFPAEGNQ